MDKPTETNDNNKEIDYLSQEDLDDCVEEDKMTNSLQNNSKKYFINYNDYYGDFGDIKEKGPVITKDWFNYKGVPIAPNSLCILQSDFFSKPTIHVNNIASAYFVYYFNEYLYKDDLHSKWYNYFFDQDTDCPLAIHRSHKPPLHTAANNMTFLWHKDHFDYWDLSFEPFIDRIDEELQLETNGPIISSIHYDIYLDGTLGHYILVKPFEYKTEIYTLKLPPLIEVGQKENGKISSIIPVIDWKYQKAIFKGGSFLNIHNERKDTFYSNKTWVNTVTLVKSFLVCFYILNYEKPLKFICSIDETHVIIMILYNNVSFNYE